MCRQTSVERVIGAGGRYEEAQVGETQAGRVAQPEGPDDRAPQVTPKRVVIVGAGFAGYEAARSLTKALPPDSGVEIVLVNPTDYFLYLPLLPEVAAAV